MNKKIIKEWGENTAYGAKSHYKTADLKRIFLKSLIVTNILFAIFSILELELQLITKIFGVVSLIASILLLIYESQEDENTISRHMKIGDEYLSIHYKLQELFYKESCSDEEFEEVSKKIERLNKKDKPIINQIAKRMAESAIENKGEMKKWWK
ncbi:hypothetical protein [Zunongwangia pacifica]|uniref:SMODS and SLOG-associating 2TM effector domain-containing protein n=1 Tax=Zunongwangia pacifica TaxID=2911062 RepID=A0A9X1ZVB2_9FLAO|nr:hypothetical protein [Zunongwangia pacifica]MCL6219103.1 hypothetical protein [Zunongwangia pacifica]